MSGHHTLGGPWTVDHPLPVTQVAGAPQPVAGFFPPTVDNPIPVHIVSSDGNTENIQEPPDAELYGRRGPSGSGGWDLIPAHPVGGPPGGRPPLAEAGRGVAIIEDAPHDGRVYARKNGAWVAIGVQD